MAKMHFRAICIFKRFFNIKSSLKGAKVEIGQAILKMTCSYGSHLGYLLIVAGTKNPHIRIL